MYINPYLKKIQRFKDHEDREGFLGLDMNENPVGLPEEFVEKVIEKIDAKRIAAYPRKDELQELIAQREGLKSENITITNGSDEAIKLLYEAFSHEGANVVMVSPTFEMYRIYAEMFGVQIKRIEYSKDFSLSIEDLLDAIDENTDIVALLNPNSPIGGIYSDEEFERMIQKAKENDAVVCIDEAYYPFGVETKVDFVKKHDNVIVLRTFSKLFSLAGVRVGYAIANEGVIRYMENAQGTYNVNTIGLLFAEELLKTPGMLEKLLEIEEEGKNHLVSELERNSYEYFAKYGNYVLIKTKKNPEYVAEELRKEKILIKTYGNDLLKDWIRVTTANKDIMDKFVKQFIKIDLAE
ncbi:MAG: histidinol-phosphate aminotransferase family protein [Agathobacter sp.]|nr:histidinol-phosphate aminotransferase family protein [Agathobacter sp.]